MSPEEPAAPPASAPAAEEPIGGPVALRLARPRQPLLAAVLVELRDGALVFAPPLRVEPPILPVDDPHDTPGAAAAARLLDSAGRILHPFRPAPLRAGDALPGTPEADAFARAHAARTRWSAAWDDALDAVRAELGGHVASLEWPAALRRPDLVVVAGAPHPLPLRVVVAIGPLRGSGWEAAAPLSVRVEIQDADGVPLAAAYLPTAAEADADALVAGPAGRAFRSLIELHGRLEAAARAARASADPRDAPARMGRSARPENTTPALRFRSAGEVANGLGFALLAAVLAGSVSRSGALAALLQPLPA
ncbi:MAG: hypothetical protein AB1941_30880, partial [Gemmatimonadota bacterium]